MHSNTARQLLLVSSTVALAACQDGLTAPQDSTRSGVTTPSIGACNGRQSERAIHSFGDGYELPGVTVTATFPAGGNLPWSVMQQMQFPLNYGADAAPCLNAPQVTYIVDTLYIAPLAPLPVPPGVDADWWTALSPREQRAIMAKAQLYMLLNPHDYPNVSSVINQVFRNPMLKAKTDAKVRANDFGLPVHQGEMLAGGIYGCNLYQNFVTDPKWLLSNDDTRDFVITLVTAFAEAEFAYSPLRALRFGRNGAVGAALAQIDGLAGDCGWLIFNSIAGGSIDVADPYATPPSSTPRPASGAQQPALPPSTGLPIGWQDF
jgi:hypothetical protein